MARLPVTLVFVDANTAMHFLRPDQIDWCGLVDASEVVLVAAPVLLRELENQKIFNGSRKLRSRAADYIRWLHPFVRNAETEVRPGVRWLFLPDEPAVDFSTERLSLAIGDDHLIASVLHYARHSSARAFVATADLGLEVKLRARGIRVLELSDNLRLPSELDPLERENRDLKRQIARIEARMPTLSVAFEGGTQHHLLSLRDPDVLTVTPLEQVRADNPYLLRPKSIGRHHDRIGEALADIRRLTLPLGISADRMVAYDKELQNYFDTYGNFLVRHADWREAVCLHHLFKCVVANEGTAPASNVDLELFFLRGRCLLIMTISRESRSRLKLLYDLRVSWILMVFGSATILDRSYHRIYTICSPGMTTECQ